MWFLMMMDSQFSSPSHNCPRLSSQMKRLRQVTAQVLVYLKTQSLSVQFKYDLNLIMNTLKSQMKKLFKTYETVL